MNSTVGSAAAPPPEAQGVPRRRAHSSPTTKRMNPRNRGFIRSRCPETSHTVREGGVEPPRPFGHWHLKPARLPIPPLARAAASEDPTDSTSRGYHGARVGPNPSCGRGFRPRSGCTTSMYPPVGEPEEPRGTTGQLREGTRARGQQRVREVLPQRHSTGLDRSRPAQRARCQGRGRQP